MRKTGLPMQQRRSVFCCFLFFLEGKLFHGVTASLLHGGAFFMTKTKNILLRLTTTAVMIAMSIVLCRLLGFPPTGTYRIELGFLPIAVIAMLYGPIWSGVAYGISDLIGAWIFTGINPFITLCKIAFGVVMGLYKA